MKVVQINACYGYGSTGIIVRDLQDICINNGIECEVVFQKSKGIVRHGYKMGNLISNKLHAFLSRISGKQGYFSVLSTIKLLRWLDHYEPSIIHLHNLHSCYVNLPLLLKYASKHQIPIVATLHDCWFYTGGCSHYTSVGCNKWLNNCGECPLRYKETPAYLFDSSAKILNDRKMLFSAVKNLVGVGVSNWIIESAQRTVFYGRDNLVIHNGIDLEFFHIVDSDFRERYNLQNKKIILAPANKWFLDINRETFDYFASRLTKDMCMIFIGDGCVTEWLTDKMLSLGYLSSREDIRDVYCAADVMVNCTREESLSLLNIEVQACGTPVITYSNTGVKETVDEVCGFSIENGNSAAMWDKTIEILLKGKEFYQVDCVNWVNKNFNKNNNYKMYIELYKRIVSF